MKMIKKTQTGVGLVEVMIALLLLGVAVLGFIALQVRAISASEEAGQNVQAMNLARDLSERMRMNREGLLSYKASSGTPTACDGEQYCNSADMARFEYAQIEERAEQQGMRINVVDCQGVNNTFKRKCVYVAWGKHKQTMRQKHLLLLMRQMMKVRHAPMGHLMNPMLNV